MAPGRPRSLLDRRQALALLGGAGAALLSGCGVVPSESACALSPALTAGPYWRDDRLERSDIRWDTHPSATEPRPGVPLLLGIQVLVPSQQGCRPLRGAQVDVWHCDAQGLYSDLPEEGTGGQDFLRGYQITDGDGRVTFTTIYPGWYPGRAVHIHSKVRLYGLYGETMTEVSTQLFFDDAVTDAVDATAPYSGRGPRDTRNDADPVLAGRGGLLVSISGQETPGPLLGTIALVVTVGAVHSG
jgi:protocatechuate 3,4-dioxygenase beta subunit